MDKNGLKLSRSKTEHLQATEDTDPDRMKRYMETEIVQLANSPVLQMHGINGGEKRRSQRSR